MAAEKEAKLAEGEAAKKAAEQKVEEAKQRLLVAEKVAARQAFDAAQGRGPGFRQLPERDNVDPNDPVERFAVLTPGGPLIVQVSLTIDGQPFRQVREKLVGEMIAGADKNKDGQTTWDEAMGSGRFTFGRLGTVSPQLGSQLTRNYDKNGDGLVQPAEAWQFLAGNFTGPAFTLTSAQGNQRYLVGGTLTSSNVGTSPDLLMLLDTDKNRKLDEKEIAAAPQRLKSRDADDNDVLDATEITGGPPAGARVVSVAPGSASAPPQNALLLGPAQTPAALFTSLTQKYQDTSGRIALGCFPLFPQLMADLDKDQDGVLAAAEMRGLDNVRPHLELTIDLPSEKSAAGMKVATVSREVRCTNEKPESTVLELPGVRVLLTATAAAPPKRNFESIGMQLLMRYDKDNNGYLEASELPAQGGQFEVYDENGDGKAYPAEIVAGYTRQFAPQTSQVVAAITQQSNSLFQTLDANGDNRLGLREIRSAAERLNALDKDGNREVSGVEIPESFSVAFSTGAVNAAIGDRIVVANPGPRPAPVSGPEWFLRMDRNGDGDLTLKEFLGDEADFKRLDANSDGLLDPQEAKAAGK